MRNLKGQFVKGHNLGGKLSNKIKKKMSIALKGKKRKPLSEKAKKHLSLFWKGKKKSKKHTQKIRLAKLGKNNPNFGKSFIMKEETKRKISETRLGKKNWMWKGGITSKNIKIRGSLDYRLWRKSVFERDNFTCQKYGISGGLLNAHHINNFADFPELRTSIENGITLSEKAHKEFHYIYGNKNNTKEQLLEFLNN